MAKVPSEDARKVKAYLDGFGSGIQHAQDGLPEGEEGPLWQLYWTLKGEERAINNIIFFLIDEFGDFDEPLRQSIRIDPTTLTGQFPPLTHTHPVN